MLQMRKSRFNTLTKSLKKAFTKKNKSNEMLGALGALSEGGEAGDPWPEAKNPYVLFRFPIPKGSRNFFYFFFEF